MQRIIPAALCTLAMVSCTDSAPDPAAAGAPAAWLLAETPADARTVAEIKPTATEGDPVVMRARIGGRRDPMTPGTPVFVVVDPGLPSCADIPGDNCPTPWDYCCEPRESLNANTATVQLVDTDADPIAAGLQPLDEIIIVGTVGPRPSEQVLTIRATGVHKLGG